jgi:hypothetical protein
MLLAMTLLAQADLYIPPTPDGSSKQVVSSPTPSRTEQLEPEKAEAAKPSVAEQPEAGQNTVVVVGSVLLGAGLLLGLRRFLAKP